LELPTSKPYHHGDLRRALVAAGIALLAEGGAAALDLRKVARKAGVSHTAPYRHFSDKRALLVAIAEEGFIRLAERLNPAMTDSSPLSAMAIAYVHFALDEPALMREMFSGLTIDRLDHDSLHQASKASFSMLIQTIQQEQASGRCVPDNAERLALVLWSLLHGLAMLIIENQLHMVTAEPNGTDQFIRESVDRLIIGLRPRERTQ
jgi:AcrR family transcriptional regulator